MAKRKTQIDRAIESLEAKRSVLELAIQELRTEASKKPARRSKAKAEPAPALLDSNR